MIFEAVAFLLKGDQQLKALIGDRVWFADAPASTTYPDIIQYPSSGVPTETLDAAGAPFTRRLSIECRGKTYLSAHQAGEHVLRILNNRVGVVGDENIQAMRLVSDLADADDTSSLKRRILDFRVTHSPT